MDGKRVFVTGGAKGIGAAIVTAFCNVGARVAFWDTDEKPCVFVIYFLLLFSIFKPKKKIKKLFKKLSTDLSTCGETWM